MITPNNPNLPPAHPGRFVTRVVVKALGLFIILNLAFAAWHPMPALGRVSAYNHLFPGRQRLPYSDQPQKAYSLSLYNLEAMFESHIISAGLKPAAEFRVILIGDSSTWGFLLPPTDTLAAQINATNTRLPDGRRVVVYNLGYPVMSLTKDLLIFSYVKDYQPDLIIWLITLESLPYDKQLYPPLLQNNPQVVRHLIETYQLKLDPRAPELYEQSFWQRTILGERRSLADLIRLQLYGFPWAATGIDQDIPETFTPRMEDLPADENFHDLKPPHLSETDLALDILEAGMKMAGDTPLLLVNEPMFISQGQNSDIRYNFYYPRWAYDDYRLIMNDKALANRWRYLDLWDSIPAAEFTNSAVHLTPLGTQQLAGQLIRAILEIASYYGQ